MPISEVAAPVRSQLAMFDAPFGDLLLDGATQCSANSPSSRRHHHSRLHLTGAHLTPTSQTPYDAGNPPQVCLHPSGNSLQFTARGEAIV